MKRFLLLTIFLYSSIFITSAQNTEIVTTAGEYYQSGSGSISWTLGELSTEFYSTSNGDVSQGFQQVIIEETVTGLALYSEMNIDVYPNPTSDQITIHVDKRENLFYQLMDTNGGVIESGKLLQTETLLKISHFSPGVYILLLQNEQNPLSVFRIIKN
jgi:hypothetical protein